MSARRKSIVPRSAIERFPCPSAAELRMVRAIALLALLEAARHGNYRASFHGFHVWAWRQPALRASDVALEVKFVVTLGRNMAERGTVLMQDLAMMPWRALEATRVIERCRYNGTNRR